MASKGYVIGRNFEYKVKAKLTNLDYYVIRAFASKGLFDLIAVPLKSRDKPTLLIQCKYSGKHVLVLSKQERTRLVESEGLNGLVCIARNGVKGIIFETMNAESFEV